MKNEFENIKNILEIIKNIDANSHVFDDSVKIIKSNLKEDYIEIENKKILKNNLKK